MCSSLDDKLIDLTEKQNWQEILQLNQLYSQNELSRFLWAWPTENCLEKLKTYFINHKITKILSIGCGSGLLEWIIQKTTGIINIYIQYL